MTSPPSPPNRRRRRIIFAAVLLVLVSAVTWWYWPRGDARFVGKWQVTYFDGSSLQPQFRMTYRANGSMSFDPPPEWLPIHRKWRVEGNRLIWATTIPNSASFIGNCLATVMHRLTGYNQWGIEFPFDIVAVEESQIALWDPTDAPEDRWILTRLPE